GRPFRRRIVVAAPCGMRRVVNAQDAWRKRIRPRRACVIVPRLPACAGRMSKYGGAEGVDGASTRRHGFFSISHPVLPEALARALPARAPIASQTYFDQGGHGMNVREFFVTQFRYKTRSPC